MTTLATDVLFVALVGLLAAVPTGHLAADRGWFPGGKDPKPAPEPDPQPEEGK